MMKEGMEEGVEDGILNWIESKDWDGSTEGAGMTRERYEVNVSEVLSHGSTKAWLSSRRLVLVYRRYRMLLLSRLPRPD